MTHGGLWSAKKTGNLLLDLKSHVMTFMVLSICMMKILCPEMKCSTTVLECANFLVEIL